MKRWLWIFLVAAAGLGILFAPIPVLTPAPVQRTIRIEASMYQYTPEEIQVNPGDQVTIELVSTDVVHGLSLDQYHFELKADPGQTAVGTFVATRSGVFRFRCLVPCGNLHPFMLGKLQVGTNLLWFRALGLGLLALIAAFWSLRGHFSPLQFRVNV